MINKKNILITIVTLIILISGAILLASIFTKKDSKLINLTLPALKEKVENKDTFVLVLSQTGCSHCQQYIPELEKALKEVDFNAYLLNISNLSDEEYTDLTKLVPFSGTPTTIFFTEGTEKTTLNRIVGSKSKSEIIERLKSLGYIS